MPKAIFMTTMTNGTPDLPPHEAEDDGLQLNYDDNGVLKGGYSCVGQVPGDVDSILVQVLSSDETLDAMAAENDYVFIENVEEPEPELAAPDRWLLPSPPGITAWVENPNPAPDPKVKPPTERRFNRGKALAFLLSHGHAAELAQTFPGAVADAVHAILDLHNISELQWQHAHG